MSKRGNGEGSLYERKDGRWVGAYWVPRTEGGQARRYVYGRTREETHGRLLDAMAKVRRGEPVTPARLSVSQYLDEWLDQVVKHRVRPKTFESYESNIRRYLKPQLGTKKLGKLSARDVRLAMDRLRADGVKPRMVQYIHATLRAALENAVREELVSRNVAKLVQVPRPQREERAALSVEDSRRLLAEAPRHRMYAAFTLCLLLGLRRGELLGLRWSDIDLDATPPTLSVRQTLQRVEGRLQFFPPKTPRSRRTVPLPRLCVAALRAHLLFQGAERDAAGSLWRDDGLLFTSPIGTPLDPSNFAREFRALCTAAAVPVVRLHDLRHTCVSLLLSLGVHPRVVMEIVGHTTLEMTMNVYGHVALETQRAALDGLDGLMSA